VRGVASRGRGWHEVRVRLAVKLPPGEGEAGLRNIRERVGPFLTEEPELVHGWWTEEASGKAVSVTVWEDDDIAPHEAAIRKVPRLPDLDASLIRQPDSRKVLDVVASWGLENRGGRLARIAWFDDAEQAAESTWVGGHLIPALTGVDGFLTLILARDVESGRAVSLTLWEGEAALRSGQDAIRARAESAGLPLPRPGTVEVLSVVHEVESRNVPPKT